MYTPLNGSVLNGSSFGVWADGAVATSSAECGAYIQRIVPGKGVVTGAAQSVSVGVREAGMFATVTAVAEQTAVGVRLAGFNSSDDAKAIGTASAPILRWSDAIAEISAALPPPIPWRHAYTDASVVSQATSSVNNNDIVVYAVVGVRRSPARASVFVHEWAVRELQTTLVPNSGFALSVARTYSIANSLLGFGEIAIAAESTGSKLFANLDYRGKANATAECTVDASRVRVYEITGPGTASTNSEPNITRASDGVTYAYMAGTSVSKSTQTCHALRVRVHKTDPDVNNAEIALTPYYILNHKGTSEVFAEAFGDLGTTYKALWLAKRHGPIAASAATVSDSIRYRWEYIEGDSQSVAVSTSDNIHYKWVGAEGQSTSTATQVNQGYGVYRDVSGGSSVTAESVSTSVKHTYFNAQPEAVAGFDVSSIVYGWAYFRSKSFAIAETTLPGLIHYKAQHVTGTAKTVADTLAVSQRLLAPIAVVPSNNTAISSGRYFLNIGKPAPIRRSYIIEPDDRVYTVGSSTREYTV